MESLIIIYFIFRYQTDAKNEGGMIAALNDYDKFQAALKDAFGA